MPPSDALPALLLASLAGAPPRRAIACALHALTLLIARQLLHELHGIESDTEYIVGTATLSAARVAL